MKVGATGLFALLAAMMLAVFVPSVSFAGPLDSDGDGVDDANDNCVNEANPAQTNSDNDTWGDECDNCSTRDNQDQCDFNDDGYGNACDADNNNDLIVGIPDFSAFKAAFGATGLGACAAADDYNNDGAIGIPDFSTFKALFGSPPGPTGCDTAGAGSGSCPPESP